MDLVALLADHQQVSTLTDACACGAGDLDTLQPRGASTNRHWRHVALVLEQEFARRMEDVANYCARPPGVCFTRKPLA